MSFIQTYINEKSQSVDNLFWMCKAAATEGEQRSIRESILCRQGLAVIDFTLGERGIQYLFAHYTYCFIPLIKELGKLYCHAIQRGWLSEKTRSDFNFQLSVEVTIAKYLAKRVYDEADYGLQEGDYYKVIRRAFKAMGHQVNPLIQLLRRELPVWFHHGQWNTHLNYVAYVTHRNTATTTLLCKGQH